MNSKIEQALTEIFKNEKLTIEFSSLKNTEEICDFLRKFNYEITIEEYQQFENEIKKLYIEYTKELTEKELDMVSGGKDLRLQVPAALLSMLTLFSSAHIGATDVSSQQSEQTYTTSQRLKDWTMKHIKKLSENTIETAKKYPIYVGAAGTGAIVLVGAGAAKMAHNILKSKNINKVLEIFDVAMGKLKTPEDLQDAVKIIIAFLKSEHGFKCGTVGKEIKSQQFVDNQFINLRSDIKDAIEKTKTKVKTVAELKVDFDKIFKTLMGKLEYSLIKDSQAITAKNQISKFTADRLADEKAKRQRLAEEQRQEAERQWLAEEQRQEAERQRLAEEQRQEAERQRLAEEQRQEAERQRLAEEQRQEAERQRLAEEQRQEAERQRLAEEQRQEAERQRLAEEQRQEAERQRVEEERKEKRKQFKQELPGAYVFDSNMGIDIENAFSASKAQRTKKVSQMQVKYQLLAVPQHCTEILIIEGENAGKATASKVREQFDHANGDASWINFLAKRGSHYIFITGKKGTPYQVENTPTLKTKDDVARYLEVCWEHGKWLTEKEWKEINA